MRERTVYGPGGEILERWVNGELVEQHGAVASVEAPVVMGDIEPYQSMATGEMITSRSQHREHLKRHHLVEIGNDTAHLTKPREVRLSPEFQQSRREALAYLRDKHRKALGI